MNSEGKARMTVFAANSDAATYDFEVRSFSLITVFDYLCSRSWNRRVISATYHLVMAITSRTLVTLRSRSSRSSEPVSTGVIQSLFHETSQHNVLLFIIDKFQDISLQQWLALIPHDIVKAHLNLDDATIKKFSRTEMVIVSGSPSQT